MVTSDAVVLDYFAHLPAVSVVWAMGRSALWVTRPAGLPPATGDAGTQYPGGGGSEVWASAIGAGRGCGHPDSGVAADHPALARKYRGWSSGSPVHDYNWWDAINGRQSAGPYDDQGHGTHTMGIILGAEADGSHAIGIAPDAQWIAVKIWTKTAKAPTPRRSRR